MISTVLSIRGGRNTIFLDANILMEVFFERQKLQAVRTKLASMKGAFDLSTSILVVSILFYYAEKHKVDKQAVHKFLTNYILLDVTAEDYEWAKQNDTGDFEDALQMACAMRHDATHFVTLDKLLPKNYANHSEIKIVLL